MGLGLLFPGDICLVVVSGNIALTEWVRKCFLIYFFEKKVLKDGREFIKYLVAFTMNPSQSLGLWWEVLLLITNLILLL